MLSLVWPALNLLKLTGSPADLPYRPSWLAGLVLLDIGLTLLQYRLLAAADLTLPVVLAPLLHLTLIAAVLWLRSRSARFVQTGIALLAIWVLLGLLLLPPVLVLSALGVQLRAAVPANEFARPDVTTQFLDLLLLSLLLWRLLAEAHVLRLALALPYAATLTVALALLLGEQWLLAQLLPAATTPGGASAPS